MTRSSRARRAALAAPLALFAACGAPDAAPRAPPGPPPHGLALPMYHFDAARSGWNDHETALTPARVHAGLARAWSTPLDAASVAYVDAKGTARTDVFPPRVFAAPLYLDDVALTAGPLAGTASSAVYVATTNAWVYAVSAVDARAASGEVVAAGTILWKTRLGTPRYIAALDHGAVLGVLSTPVIDAGATPPVMYVTSIDAAAGHQLFALDATSGAVLPGWPVTLDPAAVSAADVNAPPDAAPPPMAGALVSSQRAALALTGGRVYVGFGSYYDGGIGWMVAVDVAAKRIAASFSGARATPTPPPGEPTNLASAGVWGAGGPATSASDPRVFVTTGNSPASSADAPGVWGNSLLAFEPSLALAATYSPFDYCAMDTGDTDVGGSSPVLVDVDPARTATPHLAIFGGKQGVLYMIDRDALRGSTAARPACDPASLASPSTDASLFGPAPLAQYVPPSPGPLSVFGPYSEAPDANDLDHAKMRTAVSVVRAASGDVLVYATGTSRDPENLDRAVPPCAARLRVHLAPGEKAYLEPDMITNQTAVLSNPGSPVVTSHDGGQDAVVWVLDQNESRTAPIFPQGGVPVPNAVAYALDGTTMETLWRSGPDDLGPTGKYAHVTVAHGTVFVATDRITAFRLR